MESVDYYNKMDVSDYIYIYNDMYDFNPKIKFNFELLSVEVEILMRKQFYALVCVISGCKCERLQTTVEDIKNMIFNGQCMILKVDGVNKITYTEEVKVSGFGYYVRSLIDKLCDIYSKERIHIHGCESESINLRKHQNVKLFGLPESKDKELVSLVEYKKYRLDWAKANRSIDDIKLTDVLVVDDWISATMIEYDKVSAEDSFKKWKTNYPIQYNEMSIKLGFKFSTYIYFSGMFRALFEKGVTVIDIGCGNLYCFLRNDNFKVVVAKDENLTYVHRDEIKDMKFGVECHSVICDPEWDRVTEELNLDNIYGPRLYGYANKYILLPYKNYIDKRLKLRVRGRSLCVYQWQVGVKEIESEDEFRERKFDSTVERKYITRMNMFEDNSDHIKIAMFSASNERNFKHFKIAKKKETTLMKGRYYIGMISAEAYGFINDINVSNRRPWVEEYKNVKDFCVYNAEIFSMNSDHWNMKTFEVMLSHKGYDLKEGEVIYFNPCDKRLYYYSVISNMHKGGFQNVLSSDTMNKSISTMIKRKLKFNETQLHIDRFEALKQVLHWNDLRFHTELDTKDKKTWSLCFYEQDGRYVFVDTSGHVINKLLASSIEVKNFNGYLRMKQANIKGELGISAEECELEKLTDYLASGENRGKNKLDLWHTYKEDATAFDLVKILLSKYNLPSVDVKRIKDKFDILIYPKGVLSIPVAHDLKLFNVNVRPIKTNIL